MGDTLADQVLNRQPYTVKVRLDDLWVLQSMFKYNSFMFDPRNNQPMFPSTTFSFPSGPVHMHTVWKLRSKVNSLILRFVQEEIKDELLDLPLDYDECWYIDTKLSAETYGNAKLLLIQVLQCLEEYTYGIPMKTDVINRGDEGPDPQGKNAMMEYVSHLNLEDQDGFNIRRSDDDMGGPLDGINA